MNNLQQILKCPSVTFKTHNEVIDYLKRQDLNRFLGIKGHSFNCLFHEDNSPSAGIIVNGESQHYIYNCLSSECGFRGTIIDCVERITQDDFEYAMRFLRKVYNIDYIETDWKKKQQAVFDENIQYILSPAFEMDYPNTYKIIKNYHKIIFKMNTAAKEYTITENFAVNGNVIFFKSIRWLAAEVKQDIKDVNMRISILTYLGLIKKLKEEEVPDFLIERAKKEAMEKKQKYIISFYSIPSYLDKSTMDFAERKAVEYRQNHFTVKGWNREMLLRVSEKDADRVFPQKKGESIPELNERVSTEMEWIALKLIEMKGWTRESEIIDTININFRGQKEFKQKQIKRFIPEFLEKYLLTKTKLNKKLKKELGIIEDGYFTIIYRK